MTTWPEHVNLWKNCQRCPLCKQRDRICLARGTVPCDVLFIGEAPGSVEDAHGVPFCGPAGDLLNDIIARALPKEVSYALTNLVACFPAEAKAEGTNEPARKEILTCRPRLVEFVNVARPRLIVCVGTLATEYVDHRDTVQCLDIVHPAFILARLPKAQKGMAVNRAIVQVRNAVEDVMSTPHNFTQWGTNYASLTESQGLKQCYDAFVSREDDIPF